MPFDNPIFYIPVMTGVIFTIAGFIMLKFPPNNINSLYGYRTHNSMKSKEAWKFSQRYASMEMIKLGLILALLGLIGFVFHPNQNLANLIGLGFMIVIVVILFLKVESAIKKRFK